MNEEVAFPTPKRPFYFSKTRIKEKWAQLDIDLEKEPANENQNALDELYQDDLFGLGNE